ncbi:unnamed protein product, partial [Candidula unifasciata]
LNGHKTTISTSSDSSEDEEEARRIREALCDESIYKTKTFGIGTLSELQKSKEAKTHLFSEETKKLKSNRLHNKNDNEEDGILQTTPEFRTFVARQLSQMLDSVLSDTIQEDVWQLPQPQQVANTGIRLFSDSKTFCRLDVNNGADRQQQNPAKTVSETWKHRKHKLSTSSDSSEDEKIKACVFTVTDIRKENEYLAVLETQTTISENTKIGINGNSTWESDASLKPAVNQTSSHNGIGDVSIARKKKKKKKKKKKHADTKNTS